jgi:predicted permease
MDMVGPQYFSTVGIPILMGRDISTGDASGERVAVVNESFARRFFPHSNALGKHVSDAYYPNPLQMTIVGVAADARSNTLRGKIAPRLYAPYFRPLWQNDEAHYQVRAFGDPASVIAALRRTIRDAAPELPPVEIQPVAELVDNSLATDRLVARLSGAFGALAMLLAAIGLYGVMSWTMARRTREIGIRMAIGAQPRRIFRLVLRETLLLAGLGIAIGIPLALAAARFLQSLLFGIGLADPLVIVLASMLLAGVALLACFLPARRAARVDPMTALRHE